MELLDVISVGCDVTDQVLITFLAFVRYCRKNDLVRKEILYSILIQFGLPMELVRLIKMCLNEPYSKVCIGKHLPDTFPLQKGSKYDMLYHHCFSTLL
jgi:hypothetical protein